MTMANDLKMCDLTALDYFAAKCMPTCLAKEEYDEYNNEGVLSAAHWAYQIAETMLEVRKDYVK